MQRILPAAFLVISAVASSAASMNGFDLDNASVPLQKIERGGPPRDGIVALSNPRMLKAAEVDNLSDDARVLGLVVNGSARAYPVRYLTVHEIVNDRVSTQFFTVTYCPLCGSGVAYATNVRPGVHLNFGVSGLLSSDVRPQHGISVVTDFGHGHCRTSCGHCPAEAAADAYQLGGMAGAAS